MAHQPTNLVLSDTLTRAEISEKLQVNMGISRTDAAAMIENIIEKIISALESGDEVKISSFGTFRLLQKSERMGRNPKSGIPAKISARRVVSFHPSNKLRGKINSK